MKKYKKIFALVALLALSAGILSACGGQAGGGGAPYTIGISNPLHQQRIPHPDD